MKTIDFAALKIETGIPVPPRTHGGRIGAASALVTTLKGMPEGASFLIPISVPQNIKKEERETVFKEQAKKIMNTVSGAARRITKKDAGFNYTVRSVDGGVRVWRTENAVAETAAPEQAAA
jgi:hypothetical protein